MANVIDDQLPGGPQWIENLGHEPVWVEDKSQLKKELDKRNLQQVVATDTTPQAPADDPRFFPHGARAMRAVVLPSELGRTGRATPVPRSWMQLLSNVAATWGKYDGPRVGLHCGKCGHDMEAHNGLSDNVLTVKCGCTEYVSER